MSERLRSLEDPWLLDFIRTLVRRFPRIQQIYLLGARVRCEQHEDLPWQILIYAGSQDTFEIMRGLAKAEEELSPHDRIAYVFVETDGPHLICVWTGCPIARVRAEDMAEWHEGEHFVLAYSDNRAPDQLGARIRAGITHE